MKKLSAFSLLEAILYLALVSLFIAAIASYWGSIKEMSDRSEAIDAVNNEAQFIIGQITQTIRNSDSINTPVPATSAAAISLAQAIPAVNPTLYAFNNGSITVAEGVAGPIALDSSRVVVSGLSFTNLTVDGTKGVVRIQLTLSYNNTSGNANLNYAQTYYATATIR